MVRQIQIFILDGAPQSFDKDVIKDPPPSIHADLHPSRQQPTRESTTGKLTSLITVEDLRTPVGEGLLQRLETERCILGVRQHPGYDIPTIPIQNGHQKHKTSGHRKIRHIGAPHLVRPINDQVSQQIGIDGVSGMPAAHVRARGHAGQPHLLHEALHPLAIHRIPFTIQRHGHPPTPIKGGSGILSINVSHQLQCLRIFFCRMVVPIRSAQPQ